MFASQIPSRKAAARTSPQKSFARRLASAACPGPLSAFPHIPSSREESMSPKKVSAQFAAYVWFLNQDLGIQDDQEEAQRFARQNWTTFLPAAHEGLGKLLLKIAASDHAGIRKRVRAA